MSEDITALIKGLADAIKEMPVSKANAKVRERLHKAEVELAAHVICIKRLERVIVDAVRDILPRIRTLEDNQHRHADQPAPRNGDPMWVLGPCGGVAPPRRIRNRKPKKRK